VPRQKLVHVHAGAEELGRVYQATLPINSNYEEFVLALGSLKLNSNWKQNTKAIHEDYLAWNKPIPMPGALQYGEVIAWLSQNLPEDAIVTNGGGFTKMIANAGRHEGLEAADLIAAMTASGLDGEAIRNVRVLERFALT